MKRIALVDAGELLWRVGSGSEIRRWRVYINGEEKEGYIASFRYKKDADYFIENYDPESFTAYLESTPVSKNTAKHNLELFLSRIKEKTEAESLLICFGNLKDLNFRNELATFRKYKDRPHDKPHHYEYLKTLIMSEYNYYNDVEALEDDDVLAIIYNNYINANERRFQPIICSHDKDMLQVPGLHYHTDREELFEISVVEGLRNFYKQLISGDSVDTIPGLYQITGKKNSKKYAKVIDNLEHEEDMYHFVLSLYQEALGCLDTDDLECILWEIGNLLYLRRSWDDEGWTPPSWR